MKAIVMTPLLAIVVLAGACAGEPGKPVEAEAGPYVLTASLNPDPPKQKGTTFRLLMRDSAGDPVDDADVEVGYFMPAMGAMAEMKGNVDVEEKGEGIYLATLDLPMAGSWRIDVAVDSDGGAASVTYRLTTGTRGLRLEDSSPSRLAAAATHEEIETGTIRIGPERRQEIGVRTEVVAPRRLATTVRAVGRVVYDETRLHDVNLKIGGWIGRLEVDEPGQYVARGQTLFTLYSPELYAAQQEFLTTLASQRAAASTAAPGRADYLVEAARQRLRLWDLSAAQIDSLAETGKPLEHLPILSPVSGYVVEKNVVAGAAVKLGERLFRIAGLDRVWVEAEVYESELPLIERGQRAEVSLPYVPGRRFAGEVVFLYPYLEGKTRTGRVRIELPNPDLELKPDMYANVTIERDLGEQLSVPDEAVLYTGQRSFVFLDLGDGRLQPRRVETGVTTGERIAVLSGLEPGDRVVTSGNFLVAAEARLKLALEQWR